MSSRRMRDGVAQVATAVPSVLVALGSLGMLVVLFSRADPVVWGANGIQAWTEFFLTAPERAGREGGIAPMIVATLGVLLGALVMVIPLGTVVAVALAELIPPQSWVARAAAIALDVTAALPSVVVGLFGLSLFCEILGLGWSLLSGSLTVATMILPLYVRVAQAGLSAVPARFRLAGAALGLPGGVVIFRIVLPQAAPSFGAGLLLASGRVLAESAALLFTAGGSTKMPEGMLDSGRVLALHIFQLVMEVPGGEARACASALVLLAVIGTTGALARALPGWLSNRRNNGQ